jgi:hypothetical protein
MGRFLRVLAVMVLLASCSSSSGSAVDDLKAALIDDGASESEAECAANDLVELGYTADDIYADDTDPSPEAFEIILGCIEGGDLMADLQDGLSDVTDLEDELNEMMEDLMTDDSPQSYGDDPELDAYYDACEGGDLVACDDLYMNAPFGSEYESFGIDCGGHEADSARFCSNESNPDE